MLKRSFSKLFIIFAFAIPAAVSIAEASGGFRITGQSGVMHFVAIDSSQKDNEDVYRLAVGSACVRSPVCQVHFWVGSAPSGFPFSEAQVQSKVVSWQQNLNTGLRRWLVNCRASSLFLNERECM